MKLKITPNFTHQNISTLTSFIYPSLYLHKNNLYKQDRSLLVLCNLIILTHLYVMGILWCRKASALLASWLHSIAEPYFNFPFITFGFPFVTFTNKSALNLVFCSSL